MTAVILLVVAPLLAVTLNACSPRLARTLRPCEAVPLLTALALTAALCCGASLAAVAIPECAQWGPFPAVGKWSAAELERHSGYPDAFGFAAALLVTALFVAALVQVKRSAWTLARAACVARRLQPVDTDLVVIDDNVPTAYAVAGITGRIVVSTSLLAALSVPERRVVLAHERSHLRHRHHLYAHAAALAAAANPLLRTTAAVVRSAIERWADEDAAAEVGDRELTARALARTALIRLGYPNDAAGLAATDDHVAQRALQLLAGPPRTHKSLIGMAAAAAALCWAAAFACVVHAHNLIEIAERAYLHS